MSAPATLATAREWIPPPVRGALWMVLSCACFASTLTIVKYASAGVHPFEIAFFRNGFSLLLMLPWFLRVGLAPLRTRRFGMHLLRTISTLSVMLCGFTAVSLMPVADMMALTFTAPLFATLGAALFLGEKVGGRRWTAVVVGFAGAMIILRPGIQALTLPVLLALATAVLIACSLLLIKSLARTEPVAAIVFYVSLLLTALSLPPALTVWTTPSPEELWWLAAIGLVGTVDQIAITRSFAATDASAVLPFDFARLIFAAILGYLVFAERPDLWTWVGAAIILGATFDSGRREARHARKLAANGQCRRGDLR